MIPGWLGGKDNLACAIGLHWGYSYLGFIVNVKGFSLVIWDVESYVDICVLCGETRSTSCLRNSLFGGLQNDRVCRIRENPNLGEWWGYFSNLIRRQGKCKVDVLGILGRLGLAIVPSYRRTIVSHCSVARWHNGQSKPGARFDPLKSTQLICWIIKLSSVNSLIHGWNITFVSQVASVHQIALG